MVHRAAVIALVLLAAGAPARGEPAPPPGRPVEAAERDEALRRAFQAIDEGFSRRFSSYEAMGVFSAAVAGLACVLAEERPAGEAAFPSRAKTLARLAPKVDGWLQQTERFATRPLKPAGAPARGPLQPGLLPEGVQCNWPAGAAGLFLSEALARGKVRKEARSGCERVVRILEATQQGDGGWGHDDARRGGVSGMALPIPDPTGRHASMDYPATLTSTTNLCAAALGAARRALKRDAGEAARKARGYYGAAQNPDGSFPYDPSQREKDGDRPPGFASPADALAVPLTAGALLGLRSLGFPAEDPLAAKAAPVVDAHPEWASEGHGSATYGLWLCALEARTRDADGAAWRAFRERHFRRILDAQGPDGTFACACASASPATTCDTEPLPGGIDMPGHADDARMYVTALHAAVLALDRAVPKAVPAPSKPAPAPATTPR